MQPSEKLDKQRARAERMQSLGQVAAGIAHEVKNPLTAVKGFLQLLQETTSNKYLHIAESELDKALAILTDFLKVTKPGIDDEAYQGINVAVELESVLNLFLDRLYKVTVQRDFRDTNTTLYAKKNQIKRALFNILKNAFESIQDAGTIRVAHYVSENQLVVVIEDTGVGMDEHQSQMLGTPFFTTKAEGIGMGLSQAYAAVYEHGGQIHVQSTKGQGTTFRIYFPLPHEERNELAEIDVDYLESQTLQEFVHANASQFRERLLSSRSELGAIIEEIKEKSEIDLVKNALKLVELTLGNQSHELIVFAAQEGKLWAKYLLQVSFKLEWIETIKKVLWDYIYSYYRVQAVQPDIASFFRLERSVNSTIDTFLTHFTISYSQFKDELLQSQRELMEDLSVPIIPLTNTVCILPLIGTIDTFRAQTVQEKVLKRIGSDHIETMIIDLSGVNYLDTLVLSNLLRLFEGIKLMGCRVIVTGIRTEIASVLVTSELSLGDNVIKKGSLQQALSLVDFK